MYYTMVGSRNISTEDKQILIHYATTIANTVAYCVRSGGAYGADDAAEVANMKNGLLSNAEIFLPWDGFNGKRGNCYYDVSRFDNYNNATEIASLIHPVWNRCSPVAKKLHTRNVYQVLGMDLNTPSSFVICSAPVQNNFPFVTGGTATAVALALKFDIPVYNIQNINDLNNLNDLIFELGRNYV